MNTNKKSGVRLEQGAELVGDDLIKKIWNESWTYIKTVVDVVREPILILDKDLHVMAANEPFYRTFQVEAKDTEGRMVYELGNGQWDIKDLRKLLEDILPKHTFFKGFEVEHNFEFIGKKTMILNARQIHRSIDNTDKTSFPPIILLAMEDVTDMMTVAELLATHTKQFEAKMADKTEKLETDIEKLIKEITVLKKKI